MHIYVFGSLCRGEVDASSDVDMLAIVQGRDSRFNSSDYSIYSYARILELWKQGNPFAWHLYLESKLAYSSDNIDYLRSIGKPKIYKDGYIDCKKFYNIFLSSKKSLEESTLAEIFDLSSAFLAIRNFATCYSLHLGIKPNFSRNSACNLGIYSISIDKTVYNILERARLLSTRGVGELLTSTEISQAKKIFGQIDSWMSEIMNTIECKDYERI